MPKNDNDDVVFEQIRIKPRRSDQRVPGASGDFEQAQDFDCYVGKVKQSLGIETKNLPKIWIWSQRRYSTAVGRVSLCHQILSKVVQCCKRTFKHPSCIYCRKHPADVITSSSSAVTATQGVL